MCGHESLARIALEECNIVLDGHSRQQLVPTCVGYENRGVGSILLYFLPQTIDMSLKGMRREARIVAPHLVEQHVARNWLLFGPIQITQDPSLLLGQSHLFAGRIDQEL